VRRAFVPVGLVTVSDEKACFRMPLMYQRAMSEAT
jgi:hypothetical protein